jgi:DNA-3-methyladenine glycosylase I
MRGFGKKIEQREGFDTFLWNYVGGTSLQNLRVTQADIPAFTPLSTQISKDLKKEGFRFCGPTIV